MPGYLLDTNVLSELLKKAPETAVVERLRSLAADQIMTSALCVMELRYGTARRPDGHPLWRRIEDELLPRLTILPLGTEAATRAGDLLADLAARGEPIGVEDVLIAATALADGLTVVTRNLRHFDRVPGLRVESWWLAGGGP